MNTICKYNWYVLKL